MSRTMHSESPLEPEPTEPALTARMSRADAEALGERIQRQAARIAEATCELLEMVSEFDGRGGTGWYVGLKSTAHWLAWACSMSPGTAREHVRVARALPSMPLTVAEFRAGRLSSSKVRGVLPAEIGAEVVTALELALGRDGHEPDPGSSDAPAPESPETAAREEAARTTVTPTLDQRRADALHQVTRASLDTEPGDRSGEDRHLVIVQVSAESLPSGIPAGTSSAHDDHVPAGTLPRCGVVGQGRLEARTAERLACTGRVAVMVTDADGEVLHLGRSRRLASRAQRRALRLRDTTCTFPGCHQTRHLDAPPHHAVVRGRPHRHRGARAAVPSPPCPGP